MEETSGVQKVMFAEPVATPPPVPQAEEFPLWDHQRQGIILAADAIRAGHNAICVVGPTGCGKNRWAAEVVARAAEKLKRVLILTHRRVLLEQIRKALVSRRVEHGVFAHGYQGDDTQDIQLASIRTVITRLVRNENGQLPDFDLVIFDEAHSNVGKTQKGEANETRALLEEYKRRGTRLIGLDATPVGLEGLIDALVIIANNSELVERGILVNGDIFAPPEPDMRGVTMKKGEFIESQARKRVMECTVFGDIFKEFATLNPQCRPTVMFAPGVEESVGFAEQFTAEGIKAAHVDGNTSTGERKDIFAALSEGDLKLVSSYGVLQEGWDCQEVEHGILLQATGALSNWIQKVGRLKRACQRTGKRRYTLQDHAGGWWRHGDPDADQEWKLGDTDVTLAKKRKKACESGAEQQPIRCPQCGGIRKSGAQCPFCGHEHKMCVRVVKMTDGTLKRMVGNPIKRKQPDTPEGAEIKHWKGMLYRAGRSKRMTFNQVRGLFKKQYGHYPGEGVSVHLPDMPKPGSVDWDRKVCDVCPKYSGQLEGVKHVSKPEP